MPHLLSTDHINPACGSLRQMWRGKPQRRMTYNYVELPASSYCMEALTVMKTSSIQRSSHTEDEAEDEENKDYTGTFMHVPFQMCIQVHVPSKSQVIFAKISNVKHSYIYTLQPNC